MLGNREIHSLHFLTDFRNAVVKRSIIVADEEERWSIFKKTMLYLLAEILHLGKSRQSSQTKEVLSQKITYNNLKKRKMMDFE